MASALLDFRTIDWSRFRASREALRRVAQGHGLVYLGANGLGDETYEVVGTAWRLYLHRFPKPTMTGKVGQLYVQRAPEG